MFNQPSIIVRGNIIGFIHFPRELALCEMRKSLVQVWTQVIFSIFWRRYPMCISMWYIYIYIYIYILTNLLSTSIHGDKEKEKKTPEFRDNNISNHLLWKKDYREKKKKKRPTSSRQLKKSRDMQSVGQKNKNRPQTAALLQLQKVLNTNRANYKN